MWIGTLQVRRSSVPYADEGKCATTLTPYSVSGPIGAPDLVRRVCTGLGLVRVYKYSGEFHRHWTVQSLFSGPRVSLFLWVRTTFKMSLGYSVRLGTVYVYVKLLFETNRKHFLSLYLLLEWRDVHFSIHTYQEINDLPLFYVEVGFPDRWRVRKDT